MAKHPHQGIADRRVTHTRSAIDATAAHSGVITDGFLKTQVTWPYPLAFRLYKNRVYTGYEFTLPGGATFVNWSGANISVVAGDSVDIRPGVTGWTNVARIGPKTYTQYNVDDGLPTEYGGTSSTELEFDVTNIGDTVLFVFNELSLAYQVGARVSLQPTTDLTTSFSGLVVNRVSDDEFEIEIESVVGAGGTFDDWAMNIAGFTGGVGPAGPAGADGADGAPGAPGADGANGADGLGVPAGGSQYQILRKVSGTDNDTEWATLQENIIVAVSDETTDLTTSGNPKLTFRMPYAFRCTDVRLSVNTAPTGADIIVDVNDGGTSLFTATGTRPSIDATEKTSTTGTPLDFNGSDAWHDFADDAEVTIDIDQIGSTIAGKGLKVTFIGHRRA